MRGFRFLSLEQLEHAPIEEIIARVDAVRRPDGSADKAMASAVLGTAEAPRLRLSGLVDHVEQLAAHDNRFKNSEQMRLRRSPRKRAVANLISALGEDRKVFTIGPAEARIHKKWWQGRMAKEGQSADTVNKDFTYLAGMLARFYDDLGQDDPPRPYSGISIRDRHAVRTRKREVPVDWILDRWFAPGAFDGLNAEARDILLISIETGCRQSEIYNLPASAICLDAPIPHLNVVNEVSSDPAERREVKNLPSHRQIPLVGVALAAARRHPEGFPRYRNSSSYSAAINKYMRENDLLPPGVTVGGTRHTWESRMKQAGYDTDDRGELMGHSVKGRRGREVYGDSMSLADRRHIAEQIMLAVPDHLRDVAQERHPVRVFAGDRPAPEPRPLRAVLRLEAPPPIAGKATDISDRFAAEAPGSQGWRGFVG